MKYYCLKLCKKSSFQNKYCLDTLSLGTRRSRTKLEKTSLSANVSLRSYTVFILKTAMPTAKCLQIVTN